MRYRKRETPVHTPTPSSIKGTVEVKDGTIPGFEIGFTPTRAGAAFHAVAVSGGDFSIPLPTGEYRVSIAGLPMGYSVTSVTTGPLDLTEPFLVTEGGIADRFTSKPASGSVITVKLKLQ